MENPELNNQPVLMPAGVGEEPATAGLHNADHGFSDDPTFSGRRSWYAWLVVGCCLVLVVALSHSLRQKADARGCHAHVAALRRCPCTPPIPAI